MSNTGEHVRGSVPPASAPGRDSEDADMPSVTLPIRQRAPARPSRIHIAVNENESDSSLPSLQTVSGSSDEEMDEESAWETGSDEDSASEEDEDEIPPLERGEDFRPPTPPPLFGANGPFPRIPSPARAPSLLPLLPERLASFLENNTNQAPLEAIHEITQSFVASIRRQARNEVSVTDDLTFLTEVGNLNLGQLGGLFGFVEPEGDPQRARQIMSKLEVVPKELVKRYERLRRGVKEGNEDWERDVDGCAICRDSFTEDIDGMEVIAQEAGMESVVDVLSDKQAIGTQANSLHPNCDPATPMSLGEPSFSTTAESSSLPSPPTAGPSSPKTRRRSNDPQRILAFPCPGMHIFHAGCLAPWLERKTTCPTCRYDIDPDSLTLRLERFADRPRRPPPPPPILFRDGEERMPGNSIPHSRDIRLSVSPLVIPSPPQTPWGNHHHREERVPASTRLPSVPEVDPATSSSQNAVSLNPHDPNLDTFSLSMPPNDRLMRRNRNPASETPQPPPLAPPAIHNPNTWFGAAHTILPSVNRPPPSASTGQGDAPPPRREWKPPKNPGFERWLAREERKREGIAVDDNYDGDIEDLEDPENIQEDESEDSESEDSIEPPPEESSSQQRVTMDELVRMLFGDAPPRPPPPPPVPAIPPWEEGEAVGTLTGFAGPRRPVGVRPSPLRFGATAADTEEMLADSVHEDNGLLDDAGQSEAQILIRPPESSYHTDEEEEGDPSPEYGLPHLDFLPPIAESAPEDGARRSTFNMSQID